MKIKLPNKQIEAEVADTVLKRALGLSFQKNGQMLFKFPGNTRAPIDMMLMRESLYLYFLNSDKEIIHIEEADPWYNLPNKLFHRPEEEYNYLLESFNDLDLAIGDSLDF